MTEPSTHQPETIAPPALGFHHPSHLTVVRQRYMVPVAVVVGIAIFAWAVLAATVDGIEFVVYAPGDPYIVPIVVAGSELFAALVLFLFPVAGIRDRMRWAAMAFLTVGLARIVYGVLVPSLRGPNELDIRLYGAMLTVIVAAIAVTIGMYPDRPPPLTRRTAVIIVLGELLIGAALNLIGDWLPALQHGIDLAEAAKTSDGILEGLTSWYYALGVLPFPILALAIYGAVHHLPGGSPGGWMCLALALSATAYLHVLLWPSAVSEVMTTGHLIRMAAVLVVIVGVIIDTDQIADERARVVLEQQDNMASLTALAELRADFASMAAHELHGPLSAIRRASEVLAIDPGEAVRERMLHTITHELEQMNVLINELATSGALERLDYEIQVTAVPVQTIVDDAVVFARSISTDHDVMAPDDSTGTVLADRGRIGQVMRNLMSNSIKYSPAGTPIEIRVLEKSHTVRFEVHDQATGIQVEDLATIFEKFGRAKSAVDQDVPGMGLGLYLSYRIVQAHGGVLTVESTSGEGSVFGFDLPMAEMSSNPS